MDSIQQQINIAEKKITKAISKGLKKGVRLVKKKTIEINKSSIYKNVYKTYIPKYYQRRKTLNGLQDNKNVIFDNPSFNEDSFSVTCELEFHNITRPNPIKYNKNKSYIDINHREFYNSYFLASMIDQGYGNKDKPYNKPRPFLNNIKEHTEKESNNPSNTVGYQIQTFITKELKNLGMNVKQK